MRPADGQPRPRKSGGIHTSREGSKTPERVLDVDFCLGDRSHAGDIIEESTRGTGNCWSEITGKKSISVLFSSHRLLSPPPPSHPSIIFFLLNSVDVVPWGILM